MDINGGTPRSSTLMGLSIINHPFLGHLHLWKPPYETSRCLGDSRLLGSVTTRQPQRRTKAARWSERRVLLASRPNQIKQRECLKIHRCHTKTQKALEQLWILSLPLSQDASVSFSSILQMASQIYPIPWYCLGSHGIPWYPMVSHGFGLS